jgi:hypothetical protein
MSGESPEQDVLRDASGEDLGYGGLPICREPWESYYILRRGILPCCHGNPIIAPMTDWDAAWNSPQIQEIRRCLSRGKLSPYCLESLGCPIVQRVLREEKTAGRDLPRRPAVLRLVNRLMFRVPGRIHAAWQSRKKRQR